MRLNKIYTSCSLADAFLVALFATLIFGCFILALVPDGELISRLEKRQLAKWPDFPKDMRDVWAFPENVEKYFSDHFGFRNWFLKQYKKIKFGIGDSPSPDVIIGKEGWLFLGSVKMGYERHGDPIGDFLGKNLFSDDELDLLAAYFKDVNAWLKEKGIAYLFVIAPNKTSVYEEYLPDYIKRETSVTAMDQLISCIAERTNVHTLDLRPPLRKAKDEHLLYYKADTHWNLSGANVAQFEIIQKITEMFPEKIGPATLFKMEASVRKGGDLSAFIGREFVSECELRPIFRDANSPARVDGSRDNRFPHTVTCDQGDLVAVVFRDSFFTALEPYLSRQFKRSTYIWERLNYPTLAEYVAKEQPHIVIEEWVERALPAYLPRFSVVPDSVLTRLRDKRTFDGAAETVFSIQKDAFRTNRWISIVEEGAHGVHFACTGKDPMILLPPIPVQGAGCYMMHVAVVSSVSSVFQLFFSDTDHFTETRSVRLPIKEGRNDLYLPFDVEGEKLYLRIDPIIGHGDIALEALEVRRTVENGAKLQD